MSERQRNKCIQDPCEGCPVEQLRGESRMEADALVQSAVDTFSSLITGHAGIIARSKTEKFGAPQFEGIVAGAIVLIAEDKCK